LPAAVLVGEPCQRLALSGGEQVVQRLGDADRLVVVADLGLVVPEHRQAVVAAQALQPEVDDLPGPAAGVHDRFPDLAHAAVGWVVVISQPT
jgi:hypothetical protein